MKPNNKTVCRVCLRCDLSITGISSIFGESDKVFIYEKLNTIAELHIKPEDGLPDKICSDCLLELENAINFKQKCEISNNILASAVNTGIRVTQDDKEPLDVSVKSEPGADLEYLEEDVWSPPEVPVKLDDTDLHTLPARKSKAIDLQLECHDCGGAFKNKCKLKLHWKNIHLKEQLTCPVCQKTFGSFKTRNEHEINKTLRCKTISKVNVTGEGKNQVLLCRECEYSTSYVELMVTHLVKHTGQFKYACTLCPKQFPQKNRLIYHMESMHGATKTQIQCKICGELIAGRWKYNSHMKQHKNLNIYETCEVCNKQIKKGGLKRHMAVHSNFKTFTCDKCEATFKMYSGLWAHNRTVHEDIKHYKCDKCAYSTKHHYLMSKHRNKHTGNDFPCTTCGMFLENDLQLTMHEQRHTSNRDHKCPQCESTFFSRKNLLSHISKIHRNYVSR